nr:MAG TPA: Endonuclease [Caudoviricetes sp.]
MSKYKAKKASVDGIEFDSRKEANRYCELKLLQRAGKIQNLELQKAFELIPAQREADTIGKRGGIIKGKVIEKAVFYRADFVYTENGETVVEDVKGYKGGGAYAVFTIKRKLLLYKYGIKIKEI